MNTQTSVNLQLQKRQGLAEELASILVRRIEGGDFKLGDSLPSEKIFAETYQVSRTVVREALARLKNEGIIVSKRGSGSVVCGTKPQRDFNLDGEGDLASFIEFRMLLDSEASAMAAIRHTKEQAARLREYLDQLEQAGDDKTMGADPDYRFHWIVAEASDNEFIMAATSQLSTKMWVRIYTAKVYPHNDQVHLEHLAIYKAIIARDPAAARAASLTHLIASAARQGVEVDIRHLLWSPSSLTYL